MSEAICAQSLSVREEPTDCCYVTKEESLQDSNLFGHSSCPVCKKDCGVSCRGAKHPVRQLVPGEYQYMFLGLLLFYGLAYMIR